MDDYLTDDEIVAGEPVDDFVGLVVGDTGAMEILFTVTEDGHEYAYRRRVSDTQASSLALAIQAVLG